MKSADRFKGKKSVNATIWAVNNLSRLFDVTFCMLTLQNGAKET